MKKYTRLTGLLILWTLMTGVAWAQTKKTALPETYVVPNFHPASCGWLTDWSTERNYIANSYLDHLDKVRDDANYNFVLSECNNMIAIQNFRPERFAELKQRIREGRVELPNAFFLESTINLSGGEALVKMGVEGLRWQQQVMGVRPRYCWAIDVCGTHEQMPQICKGLNLEGLIYFRNNPFNKSVFWSESPEGSRVLTFVPGFYAVLDPIFTSKTRLSDDQLKEVEEGILYEYNMTPKGLPVLALGGSGDYSLAPRYNGNPTEFLQQWKEYYPRSEVKMTTFSEYFNVAANAVKEGKAEIPTLRGGTSFSYDAFWLDNPRTKTWFRRDEQSLQAAEMLSAIASLRSPYVYPVQTLYQSWLQLLLCMDRNTLWGAAGGMVFENEKSWDVKDRYTWIEQHTRSIQESAGKSLLGKGKYIGLFNPTNTRRTTPVTLQLPEGKALSGYTCEVLPDGRTLCYLPFTAVETRSVALKSASGSKLKTIDLPKAIETTWYTVCVDPQTGAITSLKLKPDGRELLSGHANVIVLEKAESKYPGDFLKDRPNRTRTTSSDEFTPEITVNDGALSVTVTVRSDFYGGHPMLRIMRFYKDSPRIDFETEVNDIPDLHVVLAEFPLREAPLEIRKGIPYGFAHTAWSKPNDDLHGSGARIQPAVRWSDYMLEDGSGLAILDRGLSGREINDKTPLIYLMNATSTYWKLPNAWLTGEGKHCFEYAIVPHGNWETARIPEMAWEYNSPVTVVGNCAKSESRSFVETEGDVIVEAIRREGPDIEIRLAECRGESGTCSIKVDLPHISAQLTDFTGGNATPLQGGPLYTFPVKPQQIITIRLRTSVPVGEIVPLLKWDELVPVNKREALNTYLEGKKGHPPRFFD